jgi:DNA-binding transcriptional LysR family regulator
MDLRQLRYFVAVVDTGSIGKASQRLFIRQPTLSEHIRRLEEELGTALLVRASKGVIPTAAGQALFTRAKELLTAVEQLTQAVKQPAHPVSYTLRVGFTPSLLELLLPIVGEAWRTHRIEAEPVELSTQAQLTALIDGDLDYGFVHIARAPNELREICDIEDPWVIASAQPIGGSGKERIVSLAAFADCVLVAARDGPSSDIQEQIITSLCASAGVGPAGYAEASTVRGALSMVRAQVGPAVVPSTAVLSAHQELFFRPLREQSVRARLMFLGRQGPGKSEIAESLVGEALTGLFTRVQQVLRDKDARQHGLKPRLAGVQES